MLSPQAAPRQLTPTCAIFLDPMTNIEEGRAHFADSQTDKIYHHDPVNNTLVQSTPPYIFDETSATVNLLDPYTPIGEILTPQRTSAILRSALHMKLKLDDSNAIDSTVSCNSLEHECVSYKALKEVSSIRRLLDEKLDISLNIEEAVSKVEMVLESSFGTSENSGLEALKLKGENEHLKRKLTEFRLRQEGLQLENEELLELYKKLEAKRAEEKEQSGILEDQLRTSIEILSQHRDGSVEEGLLLIATLREDLATAVRENERLRNKST